MIRLKVVTPVETLVDAETPIVTLPGRKGRFQVLKDHAPLLSSLGEGSIVYMDDGAKKEVRISSGFVKVIDNEVFAAVEQ
mgnify:FL=1